MKTEDAFSEKFSDPENSNGLPVGPVSIHKPYTQEHIAAKKGFVVIFFQFILSTILLTVCLIQYGSMCIRDNGVCEFSSQKIILIPAS